MQPVLSTNVQIKLFPFRHIEEIEWAVNQWLASTPRQILDIQIQTETRTTMLIVYRELLPVGS